MSTFAINSDSGAISRYTGFEFRGFMRVSGELYGIDDAGLHALSGDTDDGAAIVGRIDTDTLSPAGEKVSRIDRVTLGFDGGGSVVVHAVQGEGGSGTEMRYRQPAMTAGFPRPGVTKVGRGPASRYWRFSVITTGPVSIHAASLVALAMSRTR